MAAGRPKPRPPRHWIIGELEREAKRKKRSAAALAAAIGESPRTVQRIFSGETHDPGIRAIEALAETLGLELELLTPHPPKPRKAKK